jgi:hypothetical protein
MGHLRHPNPNDSLLFSATHFYSPSWSGRTSSGHFFETQSSSEKVIPYRASSLALNSMKSQPSMPSLSKDKAVFASFGSRRIALMSFFVI